MPSAVGLTYADWRRPIRAYKLGEPNRADGKRTQGIAASIAIRVLIQAPLTPSASKTRGPRQHADAPSAASIPATRTPLPLWISRFFDSDISSETELKLRTIVRNQGKI